MPVRKVSNRGGNIVGRFPSLKMGRMIAFESLLERDFIYLLDYDVRVERFEEQPLTIEYRQEGELRHYTPDFQLLESRQSVLVECKPEHFVDTEENRRKFVAARAWCEDRGWEFRVVTEQEVRAGCRLPNIKQLTLYARLTIDPATRHQIDRALHDLSTPLTLHAFAQRLDPVEPNRIMACLLHLAFHHQLDLSLDTEPLSINTLVSPRTQALEVQA
jgi:hypothetical protein